MKGIAWIVVSVGAVLVFATCEASGNPSSRSPQEEPSNETQLVELAPVLSQRIVSVESVSNDGLSVRTGTGFFVSADGTIATCAHLVEEADSIRVKTLTGAEFVFRTIVKMDAEKDLALLSVAAEGVNSFLPPDNSSVTVGTPVAVLGTLPGRKETFTDGLLSAVRDAGPDRPRLLKITVPLSPGFSGSPVVTLTGQLVGMLGVSVAGEKGSGIALPAQYIWDALKGASNKNSSQDQRTRALAVSRRRYLPGAALRDDPEWNKGNLPEEASKRLAVLRKLRARHPDDSILRIEISRTLSKDGANKEAFGELVALVKEDPGNRLAISELDRRFSRDEDKVPYMKAGVMADPLNFRAREFLFREERSDEKFLSAQVSAQRAAEIAPFFLPVVEGYAECLLDRFLYELAIEKKALEPEYRSMILHAIEDADYLRGIIVLAAKMLVTPSSETFNEFLAAAKESPGKAFPYAWELLRIWEGFDSETINELYGKLRENENSLAGDKVRAGLEVEKATLMKFIGNAGKSEPLITEAYLLDFSAVDVESEGLLWNAIFSSWEKLIVPEMKLQAPFDKLGMVHLLADAQPGGTAFDPEYVAKVFSALNVQEKTTMGLANLAVETWGMPPEKWNTPVIFQFWLAVQKERIEAALKSEAVSRDEKKRFRNTLDLMKGVPSREKAAEQLRAKNRNDFVWRYYGDEYRSSLEEAFEDAIEFGKPEHETVVAIVEQTPTPTATPTPAATPTAAPTASPTPTATPTATRTRSRSRSRSRKRTPTAVVRRANPVEVRRANPVEVRKANPVEVKKARRPEVRKAKRPTVRKAKSVD